MLRYWESEFPMLQPPERIVPGSGLIVMGRRDGAADQGPPCMMGIHDHQERRKKLQTEGRGAGRLKVVPPGGYECSFAPSTPVENSP